MATLSPLLDAWNSYAFPNLAGTWAVPPAGRAFALAGLHHALESPLLVVVPREREAAELVEDIGLFVDHSYLAPAWETLPFEHVSPNLSTMARRAEARHRLTGETPSLVVASVRALVQRLSPASPAPITVTQGGTVDLEGLAVDLSEIGYSRTDRVESRGEFAVRGGILDVFPAQADVAVRLELWGDTVDEVRPFSTVSQRSEGKIDRVDIYPAREVRPTPETMERARALIETAPWNASVWDRIAEGQLFSGVESWLPWLAGPTSLLDELGDRAVVTFVEPARCMDRVRDLVKEESELAAALAPTWGEGAPEAGEHPPLFLDVDDVLKSRDYLSIPSAPSGPSDPRVGVKGLDATAGNPRDVSRAVSRLLERETTVVVAMDGAPAADRVTQVFAEEGLAIDRVERLMNRRSGVVADGIHRGFVMPELGIAVLGEREIAGRRRAHRRPGRQRGETARHYGDLTVGDYVVHFQHGIGRFEGLVSRTMVGVERDYLVVAYAGADRLYVPVDQLAAVKKYTGGEAPRVSRMGGKDWADQKARVRQAVAAVAQQVVELHRQRAGAQGHSYQPDSPWQREMESLFPFEETPDQLKAISEVKADMESSDPMDRLVFGDVGYGKTEVAIRAAFKAVQSGKQVAVLCPTTLLAQQHHQTFLDRLGSYPVTIEVLSRFLTAKQQKDVVSRLATGEVDLVIGTHRLLSEDVRFP